MLLVFWAYGQMFFCKTHIDYVVQRMKEKYFKIRYYSVSGVRNVGIGREIWGIIEVCPQTSPLSVGLRTCSFLQKLHISCGLCEIYKLFHNSISVRHYCPKSTQLSRKLKKVMHVRKISLIIFCKNFINYVVQKRTMNNFKIICSRTRRPEKQALIEKTCRI